METLIFSAQQVSIYVGYSNDFLHYTAFQKNTLHNYEQHYQLPYKQKKKTVYYVHCILIDCR